VDSVAEIQTPQCQLDIATLSDVGTERDHNEDACGSFVESSACAVVAVADGVSSAAGGEVASGMAIEVLLGAYREEPPALGAGQRLYRAVQQANIAIYDRAVVVPELRGMATTLTTVAVERGELTAVHVGDSRLYLLRDGAITQLTKDHTVAAEKVRYGLLSKEKARTHADRCVLTRSVGRELIVARDRITQHVLQGDVLLLCSDGLHGVLQDHEVLRLVADRDAAAACRALVDAANARGTPDNLTAAVLRMTGPTPAPPRARGLAATLRRVFRRSA
jgi:PPM family protein phosphatase